MINKIKNIIALQKNKEDNPGKKSGWLKKLGFIGFLFFLVKGLVWLGIFTYAWIKLKG